MDMTNRLDGARRPPRGNGPAMGPALRPAAVAQALWRRRGSILLSGVLAALAAAALLLTMPRTFTSTAQILIDPRGLKVLEKEIVPQAREPDLSVSVIESEMRFIGSELVLQRVIDRLRLAQQDMPPPKSGLATVPWLQLVLEQAAQWRNDLKAMLGRGEAKDNPNQGAMLQLQRSLKITRQPNTYVLDLAVTSKDRELAARIASTVAAEYIAARFDGRVDASRKASEAIGGRLEELRGKVREADAAVERYKAKQGLASSSGRLLTDQRMSELATQLQSARADTVKAEARMAEIRTARTTRAANTDSLQSATLERLRSTLASARQREAALAATLLPAHPMIKQARLEVQSVERSLDQELARLADTATAALERARATERVLDQQLKDLMKVSSQDGAAQVELRELERVAEANRSIYQTLLLRSRELVEQQRIDPNLAVMLAEAEPARDANGPNTLVLIAAASLAGLGLGAGFALRRDARDPYLRSEDQLEALFAPESTHKVPIETPRRLGFRIGAGARTPLYFVAPAKSPTAAALDRLHRSIAGTRSHQSPLVFLVVAAEPFQGKSTIALNLAAASARAGDRTLLVDADSETMLATAEATATGQPGLAEVITGSATPAETIVKCQTQPPLDLLPAGALAGARHTRGSMERLDATLIGPLSGYDVVVVDGAATANDRLTMALAGRADACLLVAQAGGARRSALEDAAGWLESATGGEIHMVLVSPE